MTGFIMLVSTIIGYITTVFLIGFLILFVLGIWIIVDFVRLLIGSLKDAQGRELAH